MDLSPQNKYKVMLRTHDHIVHDGKLYYDNKVTLMSSSKEYEFKKGDLIILDMKSLFSDFDQDILFYDVNVETNHYFTSSGFNEHLYFNAITISSDLELEFYTTDLYGKTLNQHVTIRVVDWS